MDLCDPLRVSELEVIVAAALTAHAKEIHVPLRRSKFRHSKYPNLFPGEVQRLSEGDKMLFKRIIGPSHPPQYEQEQALKKALILYQWISSSPTGRWTLSGRTLRTNKAYGSGFWETYLNLHHDALNFVV
jgi:hypothetical protein